MLTKTSLKLSIAVLIVVLGLTSSVSNAQYLLNSDSAYKAGAANSGRIWGYIFGDYYYKAHADSAQRGGSNQYTGIPQSRSAFQSRRIYLGYDYNISNKFTAELLLAAEDDAPTSTSNLTGNTNTSTSTSSTSGNNDALQDNKLAFYIKLANLRWKGIWKGTDFVVGQIATPTFALMSEKVWNYRSVERTITDIRRTPSYDMGAALQGTFDPSTKNFGYNVMIANGSSAKPESDNFKCFYGDVYGYFLDKKLVVDLYADYQRSTWTPALHNSRQMNKIFVAYNTAATAKGGMVPGTGFTVGVEYFVNNLQNDLTATKIAGGTDLLDNQAQGLSVFVHGDITKSKLRYFARYDYFTPNTKVDNSKYNKYASATSNYKDAGVGSSANDQTYKQQFITAGLDYMPAKNVHIIPNVWYNTYASQLTTAAVPYVTPNSNDLVYRLTFHYIFGK